MAFGFAWYGPSGLDLICRKGWIGSGFGLDWEVTNMIPLFVRLGRRGRGAGMVHLPLHFGLHIALFYKRGVVKLKFMSALSTFSYPL
jgi:hypothetical protein